MKNWVLDNKAIKEWRLGEEVYELVNWPIRLSTKIDDADKSDEARKQLWHNLKSSLAKTDADK